MTAKYHPALLTVAIKDYNPLQATARLGKLTLRKIEGLMNTPYPFGQPEGGRGIVAPEVQIRARRSDSDATLFIISVEFAVAGTSRDEAMGLVEKELLNPLRKWHFKTVIESIGKELPLGSLIDYRLEIL